MMSSQRLPLTVKVKAISHPHRPENMMQTSGNIRSFLGRTGAARRDGSPV